jgi:hypothetical protein
MSRVVKLLAVVSFSVLLVAGDHPRSLTSDRLLGKWYQGDGTGYNIDLTLNQDWTYSATWTGCLGTYGTARGRWHLDGTKITLQPTEENDAMRDHLRVLNVLSDKGLPVLVQPRDVAHFKEYGSKPHFWCFTREE